MRQFLSRLVVVVSFLASALALTGAASAQSVPHHARGGAQFISDNDFVGGGVATHLGRYSEVGRVTFAPTRIGHILAITGWATYTAANGDELRADISGLLDVTTGEITATLTYVGGTGRFVDASGSSVLVGQMLGGGAVQVAVLGNVEY